MSVFDGDLPPENTPYPFVYLENNQLIDQLTKGAVIGTVHQSVSVWHSYEKRGSLSALCLKIKDICRGISKTNNFKWFCRNIEQQILPDKTTSTPLLHGVIDVEFRFS